jgi:TRAP-type C4-dicarboxylate transport system permease small subunit
MPHSASPASLLVRKSIRLILDQAPRYLMAALLLVAVAINFSNVIGRYVFQAAIFWTDEILVFLIIWCVFIGNVAVAYNGAHLKMDLFSARMRGPTRLLINASIALGMLACSVVMVWQSTQVVLLLARTGQVSVTASIPMSLVHIAIPLGFALMALAVLARVHAYLTDDFE